MSTLPGSDLVALGLADLERGVISEAALLAAIGAPRLRGLGLRLPEALPANPEIALYLKLQTREGDGAHGAYQALIRRLESFERALERQRR